MTRAGVLWVVGLVRALIACEVATAFFVSGVFAELRWVVSALACFALGVVSLWVLVADPPELHRAIEGLTRLALEADARARSGGGR